MLTALILAGGASTRMGSPKALLADADGRPFILRIVHTLQAAGLQEIVIVAGIHHDPIAAAVAEHPLTPAIRLVRNPDPDRGQLSSIWCGLDAAPPATDALLMTLVDVPMIATATVRAVIDAWQRTHAPIVRPIVDGRRGHPVSFDRQVFGELRAAPLDAGARAVVRAHWGDSIDVGVDDRGCLVDVDTPGDYQRLLGA